MVRSVRSAPARVTCSSKVWGSPVLTTSRSSSWKDLARSAGKSALSSWPRISPGGTAGVARHRGVDEEVAAFEVLHEDEVGRALDHRLQDRVGALQLRRFDRGRAPPARRAGTSSARFRSLMSRVIPMTPRTLPSRSRKGVLEVRVVIRRPSNSSVNSEERASPEAITCSSSSRKCRRGSRREDLGLVPAHDVRDLQAVQAGEPGVDEQEPALAVLHEDAVATCPR